MDNEICLEKPLQKLTEKQREVLDLLIKHKTSKEIARTLSISPYTVDQRISAARKKLGVTSRNKLAQEYRKLTSISEDSVYQFSHVEFPRHLEDDSMQDIAPSKTFDIDPKQIQSDEQSDDVIDYRVVPEIFEGPHGVWARLITMGALAMMLLLIVLGGVAAFGQLTDLLK